MPSKFEVTVRLNIPREVLWRVRASRTFMDFLVRNGALQRMESGGGTKEVMDATDGVKCHKRKLTYVPGDIVIPEVIKPIIDESYIEIVDEQTWQEDGKYKQRSHIRPSILGDVITTRAMLHLEEDNDNSKDYCLHTLKGDVGVTILFLGYYVEQAVITNMKQFYENYPSHIDDFVTFVCQKYGNGQRSSLESAVDKMLLAEQKSL